jgi:hypothetical protein
MTPEAEADATVVGVRLRVGGMLCEENCARGVEHALAACALPTPAYTVADARVDFPARTAHVTLASADGAAAAAAASEVVGALRRAVEAAGYEVGEATVLRGGGREEGMLSPVVSGEPALPSTATTSRQRRARRGSSSSEAAAGGVGMEIGIGGLTW